MDRVVPSNVIILDALILGVMLLVDFGEEVGEGFGLLLVMFELCERVVIWLHLN